MIESLNPNVSDYDIVKKQENDKPRESVSKFTLDCDLSPPKNTNKVDECFRK